MSASAWFKTKEIAPGAWMLDEPGHVQSYLLIGQKEALLIDTGLGLVDIAPAVHSLTKLPVRAANTHWHFDHLGSNASFQEIGCSAIEAPRLAFDYPNQYLKAIYLDSCQAEGMALPQGLDQTAYAITGKKPTFTLEPGRIIDLGGRRMEILATPGHTAGSISLLDKTTGLLFSGDLAYPGTLYAMFDDSNLADYAASLATILERGASVYGLCSGHFAEILPLAWLEPALEALKAVLGGRKPEIIDTDWGAPCHRHQFKGFDILATPPGGEGVDLRP